MGFPIGVYVTNIFEEASRSPEGYITVDFLRGIAEGGRASESLQQAIMIYRDALPALCEKQSVQFSSIRALTARYSNGVTLVTVEDERGRKSIDEYVGLPLRLVRKKR
jgi:hypothetical protein